MHLYTDPNAAHVALCLCLFLQSTACPSQKIVWGYLFQASDDSSLQIDYFFVSQHSELNESASIEGIHHLNLSGHTPITLSVNK